MFSIGEFSTVTGLTVKTLRFYHEQGVLEPTSIDPGSGYRFYSESKIEVARVIAALRDLGFSVAEVKEILRNHDDDADILTFLESRRQLIEERMRNDRQTYQRLKEIITHEREAIAKMSSTDYQIEEKMIEPMLIARVRMQGKYSDCGPGYGKIGRKLGRHICGKAMMLCHDNEYRENDATFDVAMPVRKGESVDDIVVEELPGGRCISLMHLGPYPEMGRTYERLLKYAAEHDIKYQLPTREVYIKGPGMIFRGNPKKYLTEVQLMIKEA